MAEASKPKRIGAGVGVILEKDGMILLGRRNDDPNKAGSAFRSAGEWTLPGGKLEWGETIEEGAIREVLEETGIRISKPEVVSVHNCRNEYAHFITIGLLSRSWQGEESVMEPDEITEWQWFALERLPTPLFFPSREVIENHIRGAFYILRK